MGRIIWRPEEALAEIFAALPKDDVSIGAALDSLPSIQCGAFPDENDVPDTISRHDCLSFQLSCPTVAKSACGTCNWRRKR